MADETKGAEVKVQGGGKGTAVNLRESVKVYATDKHPYAGEIGGAGKELVMSPALAEDAIKRGFATKTKPAQASDKK